MSNKPDIKIINCGADPYWESALETMLYNFAAEVNHNLKKLIKEYGSPKSLGNEFWPKIKLDFTFLPPEDSYVNWSGKATIYIDDKVVDDINISFQSEIDKDSYREFI